MDNRVVSAHRRRATEKARLAAWISIHIRVILKQGRESCLTPDIQKNTILPKNMKSLNFQYQENHLYLVKDEVKDITSGVRSIHWECPAITEHTLSEKGPVFCLAAATVKHPSLPIVHSVIWNGLCKIWNPIQWLLPTLPVYVTAPNVSSSPR